MVQEFKHKYKYTNTNTQPRQRCNMCQCSNTNTNTRSVFKCVCQRSKCLKQRRWDFNVALTSPAAAWTQLSHPPQNSHPRSSTLTIRDGKRQQLKIMINSTMGLLVFKWIFLSIVAYYLLKIWQQIQISSRINLYRRPCLNSGCSYCGGGDKTRLSQKKNHPGLQFYCCTCVKLTNGPAWFPRCKLESKLVES